MDIKPFPGYEDHLFSNLAEQSEEVKRRKEAQAGAMLAYELPQGMTMEDRFIPTEEDAQELQIRIFTPADLPEKAPIILDIHGGAFVAGSVAIDNARCIAIAQRVPAIVVSVEYRLAGADGVSFPMPLEDCHAAYRYLHEHAEELGGDPERMGLHGSSAGATIAEGLALYLRDRNEPQPALTVLNCPALSLALEESHSYHQLYQLRMGPANKALGAESAYLGGYNGKTPSYYAFPACAPDLGGLKAHMVIVGEYDTLRDTGLDYALRLLRTGVPCEIYQAPRLGHCYTSAPHPFTDFTHDMMAWSFKREFGMLDDLIKK
ncbi:alpha/beta hydrolase [Streptococcus devriesei]|uniref:alpha/beta hydrolase n=1 Tax=Streptococcus devriesei TaxID=231233 RepID=UPI00040699F6|nr:alpha/beta hydrolase [Streptococcus devriesei]